MLCSLQKWRRFFDRRGIHKVKRKVQDDAIKEIEQAIKECLREPVAGNKRAVLSDLIIIQDYLFGETTQAQEAPQPHPMQSYSAPPMEQVEKYIETNGDSEFLKAVDGRKADKVWKLIDELVEAVKILHPRMYTTFIDKVQDL